MDWDSENFVPPPLATSIVNKWDGEDEEENVKDNWEDDDEEKKREELAKKQSQQSKKPRTKLQEKIGEREKREEEEKLRKKMEKLEELEKELDEANLTPEQIQAIKLRRQQMQEESDLELAKEILGVSEGDAIDTMNPKTKEDFEIFKEALCKKVLAYKKFENFPIFVEELFRDLSAGLGLNELRKVKLNLDNMLIEKSRVEKGEKPKKAKGKGKAKLRVENNDMMCNEYSAYTIDDYDDFM